MLLSKNTDTCPAAFQIISSGYLEDFRVEVGGSEELMLSFLQALGLHPHVLLLTCLVEPAQNEGRDYSPFLNIFYFLRLLTRTEFPLFKVSEQAVHPYFPKQIRDQQRRRNHIIPLIQLLKERQVTKTLSIIFRTTTPTTF